MINISDGHQDDHSGLDKPEPFLLSSDTFVEYLGPTAVRLIDDLYTHELEHPPEDNSVYALFRGEIEGAIAEFYNSELGMYEPTSSDIDILLDDAESTLKARIDAGSSSEIVFEKQRRWIVYLREHNSA